VLADLVIAFIDGEVEAGRSSSWLCDGPLRRRRVAGRSLSLARCPPPRESWSHDRSVGFGHRRCVRFDPGSLQHRGVVATPGCATTVV
jgi:hypothetical protein